MSRQDRTIFIARKGNKINGVGIIRGENGWMPFELEENVLKGIYAFSNVITRLQQGELLQIYKDQEEFIHIEIGAKCYEGPYAETEYLEIHGSVEEDSITEGLFQLNSILEQPNNKYCKKKYRPYGQVHYE